MTVYDLSKDVVYGFHRASYSTATDEWTHVEAPSTILPPTDFMETCDDPTRIGTEDIEEHLRQHSRFDTTRSSTARSNTSLRLRSGARNAHTSSP
jgi:hypothetical protein